MDLTAAEAQTTAPNSAAGPTSSDVVSPWWSIAGVAVAPFWASGRGRRLARRTFAPASGRTAVPVAAALLSGPLAVVTLVLGWVAGLAWWELLLAAFLVPNAAFVCLLVAGAVVSGRRERREQAAAHVVRLVDTQNRPESDAAELPQTPLRGDPWDLELLGSSLGSSRMRAALEARQLQIALQPIIDLNTGAIVSVEALARFPDTRPPNEWFAEAHALGFGADLELQALETAFAMVNELPGDVRLAVNVSPKVTLDPRLSETLLRSGIPMERVILEITEHTAVAHYPSVRDALLPLRGSGVRLAVDDAGAGYASFAHVLQLRPEIIKLDRSLVFGIDRDPAARAFVTGVVLLALELGASVVAEGVETEAQRVQLEALGIDYVQGFLLASPTTDASEWRSWAERTWAVGSTADVTDPLDTIRITREIHV
jgi:EAL domain-containing protein (putative c-di-GMP-specific phosphodiesterase class I)